ncbi:alpha/beta fold hydrolase [Geitlerinema calcuttense]|uniref:Alpha/beta hydrolase n=1 Tax=Geitlerinema calcuttense NRMC-F 0142 TaxID=2922238 RepID=A0ABT7LZ64_9CYAN|nr:alpha/beta hydrolase [Geitlerinema calcuttense]MDI9640543.1 alpha/beta hydrolase [Geitlerinema splendidum]MDL5057309.1 alpha/beta hydrolase [Geitlerinema calcuttense NRMC-F 0142]
MSEKPECLWLTTNPSLQSFDQPLLQHLSQHLRIGQWTYYQSADEPCSLEIALELLHDYLTNNDSPSIREASPLGNPGGNRKIHLIGHGTGGLLGLLYAARYPEKVKSLTLLGVGVHPALNWHAHYYVLRQLLPCSRYQVLTQMVHTLLGQQSQGTAQAIVSLLERDLDTSISPHSLYKRASLPPVTVSVPLLVCGSQNDPIVDSQQIVGWKSHLKKSDRIWLAPQGYHFFHYFYPQEVGRVILQFWKGTFTPLLIPSCVSEA